MILLDLAAHFFIVPGCFVWTLIANYFFRAIATSMAGTVMALPLFDKVTNKFECILSLMALTYLIAFILYVIYSHYKILNAYLKVLDYLH